MLSNRVNKQPLAEKQFMHGGLPVRTNLRVGLAWDDLDDQAAALWSKLTGAVSNTVSGVTGSTTSTPTS